ncbi:MAG: hypothetical protein K1X83_09620 [Oligoflexia bacterium]|nr:hypothetical protein [Oligoflexia bacterium]
MGIAIIVIVGLLGGVGVAGWLYSSVAKRKNAMRSAVTELEDELKKRQELKAAVDGLLAEMVDQSALLKVAEEVQSIHESLKAERGRIMITQAELETVESRLRELEEIEREFEASGLETKQELQILQKKREELAQKNNTLKEQIDMNSAQLDQILGEIQMTAQQQAQIQGMKTEIIRTQERIEQLLMQIEQGNEQYAIAKRRYDALDIEYAQLYEKFSESEPAKSAEE